MIGSTGRHRRPRTPQTALMSAATIALVSSAIAAGTGIASAVPEQGGVAPSVPEQGGVSPTAPVPEQGGTAPEPTPPPAPPAYDPGPGLIPSPPQGQWQPAPAVPETYPQQYNPAPPAPLHAPRPAPPVKRIQPAPDTLRIGNAVFDIEDLPAEVQANPRAIVSANEWAAYAEAEIARGMISIGIPEDEATRRAAAAVIGVAAGGGAGFAVGFTATALLVGPVLIPVATLVGAGIGAAVGTGTPLVPPMNTLAGAGIGAGIGLAGSAAATVAAATAVGVATGVVGAAVGGLLAYALGAGDPGASAPRPDRLPWEPTPESGPDHRQAPGEVAAPGGPDQFEVRLTAEEAAASGLPPVSYVVTSSGDVQADLSIGGQTFEVGWTAEQAQAPIRALGAAAPVVEGVAADVAAAAKGLEQLVPGLTVTAPSAR